MSTAKDLVHAIRKRARRRGLRVIKRGDVLQLCDASEVLCVGSESDLDGYLDTNFAWSPYHPVYTLGPEWQTAVDNWRAWLGLSGMSPHSVRLRYDLVRAMARHVGSARPADVTLGDLERYCGGKDWSREHRRAVRTSLTSFFDWAVRNEIATSNPATGLPAVLQDKPRPVTDDVWRQLVTSAPARELLMIRLAGEAGMRRAEVARCRRDDLIGRPGAYSLRIVGKGERLRIVPITDSLADAIRAHCVSGFLFPGDDSGHLSPPWVGTMISELMPPGWSMHKLRTMYGTRAFKGSRNIRAVQELLGHASVATTERYVAVDDDEIRAAAVAASAGLFGVGA